MDGLHWIGVSGRFTWPSVGGSEENENFQLTKYAFGDNQCCHQAAYSLINLLLMENRDIPLALQLARRVVMDFHDGHETLAAIHTNVLKQHSDACTVLLSASPNPAVLLALALLYEHKFSDYSKAAVYYAALEDEVPHYQHYGAMRSLYAWHFPAEQRGEPRPDGEAALRIARALKAEDYTTNDAAGLHSQAVEYARHPGLELDGDYGFVYAARYHLTSKPATARDLLLEAVGLDPDYSEAHFMLGVLLMDKFRDPHRALQHLQHTLRINESHVEAHLRVGLILAQRLLGYAQARTHFERVLVLDVTNVVARHCLDEMARSQSIDAARVGELIAEIRLTALRPREPTPNHLATWL